MRILFAMLVLSGCGPRPTVCTAAFSGNFADSSSGNCPVLEPVDGGTVLRFRADAPSVNSSLSGSIALGGTTPSTLSSQTATGDWSAVLTREPGCLYLLGRDAVPAGTFSLTLDPPHGTLELHAYVHALPMADCGRGDVETIRFDF